MRILHIVGARPNFVKAAPVMRGFAAAPQAFDQTLVHTGQHYDANMSDAFFRDLDFPRPPDVNLEVGSDSHARQTARVLERLEPILLDRRPDWVVVYGDVNSTLAGALASVKLGIPVAHVEAGLRSFDRSMPEEINRLLTDQVSDLLLTPTEEAGENLKREGIAPGKIRFVGNVMIDTLAALRPRAEARWLSLKALVPDRFILITLHRPSNVDDAAALGEVMNALRDVSADVGVVFPVHPRTRERLRRHGITGAEAVRLMEPLGYVEFLALMMHAQAVLTDSGGVQEETTFLGVPCLTARPNTERPITMTHGTNRLVESRRQSIVDALRLVLRNPPQTPSSPPSLWDGRTAGRIVDAFRTPV